MELRSLKKQLKKCSHCLIIESSFVSKNNLKRPVKEFNLFSSNIILLKQWKNFVIINGTMSCSIIIIKKMSAFGQFGGPYFVMYSKIKLELELQRAENRKIKKINEDLSAQRKQIWKIESSNSKLLLMIQEKTEQFKQLNRKMEQFKQQDLKREKQNQELKDKCQKLNSRLRGMCDLIDLLQKEKYSFYQDT